MSVVIIEDEIVHYEVLGRGKPLIFLHGWVGSWRYWIPAMQGCSVSFRAYAIDLWGFGDTSKNPSYYSLAGQATLIRHFMERMGLEKTAIIGHGLGACAALHFASLYPDSVDRVLAISIPHGEDMIHPRLSSSSPAELAEWLLGKDSTSQAIRVEASKTDPRAIQASFELLPDLNLNELSTSLKMPCLFLHGQTDPAVNPPGFDELLGLPEHTHHHLFEGSGHFPMLDESNKFNRLLADFLTLPSGTSPRQLQVKEEWKRRVR
jgi:pimeloyl-ACP methyl ester carboxylesterase